MDDIRAVAKELRRIADANERIAKALEKRECSPVVNFSLKGKAVGKETQKVKQWVTEAIEESIKNET